MKKWLIVTNIWGKKKNAWGNLSESFKEEREYFDTFEDLKAYIKLFEEICSTYKMPEEDPKDKWYNKRRIGDHKTYYNFKNENERVWGYVVGNTETQTIEKWGGISLLNLSKKDSVLRQKDYLFRGPDEIPKNYKWDSGEYEGWLQYRWGDGKNAIGYVEPKKKKKIEDIAEDHSEAYERLYDLMDKRDEWIREHPTEYEEYLDLLVEKFNSYETSTGEEKFKELEELNSLISSLQAEMLSEDEDFETEEDKRQSDFADALEDAFAKDEEKERIKLLENRW